MRIENDSEENVLNVTHSFVTCFRNEIFSAHICLEYLPIERETKFGEGRKDWFFLFASVNFLKFLWGSVQQVFST